MEIVRLGKGIEDITVGELIRVLKDFRDEKGFPEEYQQDGYYRFRDNLRDLDLVRNSRITDLGLNVLEHYEKSKTLAFPEKFAKRVAALSRA